MVLDAMLVGGMIGNYAARGQFESMSLAQQQQSQIEQAQAQAAQAEQAAKAAQTAQAVHAAANQSKDDLFKQLEN
jgi:hypothetical protein